MSTGRDFARAPGSEDILATDSARGVPSTTGRDFARAPGSSDALPTDPPRDPASPEEPTGKDFDPSRFAATTLPPGFRGQLLAAELPVVPSEDLQDTLPPNRERRAPSEGAPAPTTAPAESPPARGPLRWVGFGLGIALAVFVIALSTLRREDASPPEPAATTPVVASPSPARAPAPALEPGLPAAAPALSDTAPAAASPESVPHHHGAKHRHVASPGSVFDSPLVPPSNRNAP